MTNEEASAQFRIDLWQNKVASLRRELFDPGPSPILRMHFRSELRIYGLLLAQAKDDLAGALCEKDRSKKRRAAWERYSAALQAADHAWREAETKGRDILSDATVMTFEYAADEALCAWIDS